MRNFTLFGLDEGHQVVSTETLSAESLDAARRTAHERLAHFARVEVWEESVCIARLVRPSLRTP